MDISSEEETNKNPESHQFSNAYSEIFCTKENYFEEGNDYIKPESIYFNYNNIFIEEKEKPHFTINADNPIPKQKDFKLFNKWSSNYNTFEKYSKKCLL